jgi:glycosyltransferase involved in cell wall biosynthesis
MAGGVERVLTLKANYLAEHYGYDITIILTEGKGKPLFYPLSDKVHIINLDIGFEALWTCSFLRKIPVYLCKQRRYKRKLRAKLMRLRPDITVSLLRREINFLCDINDGSRKVGEMHINRANYRNFDTEQAGWLKRQFARLWSHNIVAKLQQLDRLVVLTDNDREAWTELDNVVTIPDPLSLSPHSKPQTAINSRRIITVARYSHEKGIDLLLKAWALVEKQYPEWSLHVFGDGERMPYEELMHELNIDTERCHLNGRTNNVEQEYLASAFSVVPSRFEGFGMVITESMACGVPVVAFNCPWGPQAIIHNDEDGLLIENGNVEALADGIMRLMGDDGLREQMAKAGAESVKRFSIENIARQWHELFTTIIL